MVLEQVGMEGGGDGFRWTELKRELIVLTCMRKRVKQRDRREGPRVPKMESKRGDTKRQRERMCLGDAGFRG